MIVNRDPGKQNRKKKKKKRLYERSDMHIYIDLPPEQNVPKQSADIYFEMVNAGYAPTKS